MDYEKKYKEALEDMRAIYPNLKGDAKLAVEHAFPELKESEDERIRKEIIHYILYKANGVSEEQEHKWIAYLEKQKENPKSADSISSDCVSDAKCEDRWHKVEDSLPDNGREVLAKDKWCEIPFEKPKEQKPNKQTEIEIEEAAEKAALEFAYQYPIENGEYGVAKFSFMRGAEWQRQQGIVWSEKDEGKKAYDADRIRWQKRIPTIPNIPRNSKRSSISKE